MGFRAMMACLRLMRFRFHLSYITVIMGAMMFSPPGAPFSILPLLQIYILFNVLLYGGIYTFNDIIDRDEDRRHGTKKNRPLPSGQISVAGASFFSCCLIASALCGSGYFFSWTVTGIFIVFISVNALYTLVLKNVPYAGLSLVALTHTLRLVLGVLIGGATLPLLFCTGFYVVLFCMAVTLHGTYNVKRKDKKYYPPRALVMCQLACAAALAGLAGLAGLDAAAWTADHSGFPWQVLIAVFLAFVVSSHLRFMRRAMGAIFMTTPGG